MQSKQYMLFINNSSKAVVLPFPMLLDLPETKEVNGTTYVRTNRKKTFPDYKAVIYVEANSTIDIEEFADAEEVKPEEISPITAVSSTLPEVDQPLPAQATASSAIDKSKLPVTKVYGTSDDLIEFEGAFSGEVGAYGTGDKEQGVLLNISDGTVLEIKYGKLDQAIWHIKVLKKGAAYDNFDPCDDEDADIYSDIVTLRGEVKWAYASTEWEKVQ